MACKKELGWDRGGERDTCTREPAVILLWGDAFWGVGRYKERVRFCFRS